MSAGGIHVSVWDYFSNQMDEWAVGTTLIPSHGGGFDASNMIRFTGASDDTKRVNTCVVPNFMCGINPVVPAESRLRAWRNLATSLSSTSPSPNCPLNWGFYAALYSAPCDSNSAAPSARATVSSKPKKRPA